MAALRSWRGSSDWWGRGQGSYWPKGKGKFSRKGTGPGTEGPRCQKTHSDRYRDYETCARSSVRKYNPNAMAEILKKGSGPEVEVWRHQEGDWVAESGDRGGREGRWAASGCEEQGHPRCPHIRGTEDEQENGHPLGQWEKKERVLKGEKEICRKHPEVQRAGEQLLSELSEPWVLVCLLSRCPLASPEQRPRLGPGRRWCPRTHFAPKDTESLQQRDFKSVLQFRKVDQSHLPQYNCLRPRVSQGLDLPCDLGPSDLLPLLLTTQCPPKGLLPAPPSLHCCQGPCHSQGSASRPLAK